MRKITMQDKKFQLNEEIDFVYEKRFGVFLRNATLRERRADGDTLPEPSFRPGL